MEFEKLLVRFWEGNSSWICGTFSKKNKVMRWSTFIVVATTRTPKNWTESLISFLFQPTAPHWVVDSQVSISPNKQRWSHFSDPKMTPCKSHPKNSPQKPWWGLEPSIDSVESNSGDSISGKRFGWFRHFTGFSEVTTSSTNGFLRGRWNKTRQGGVYKNECAPPGPRNHKMPSTYIF